MIRLELPYPPTINHYYGVRGKGRYIKPEGLAFRKAVADVVQMVNPIAGKVGIHILVFPPDKRKRDLDNVLKALLDALTHAGAWVDDSQIWDLQITRGDNKEGGGTIAYITDLTNVN